MADKPGNSDRTTRHRKNLNLPQFDRELILAARDKLTVDLFFDLDSVLTGVADASGLIEVVDRYFLKFKEHSDTKELLAVWIQKAHLAGVRVVPV